jgi:hypothetical protein
MKVYALEFDGTVTHAPTLEQALITGNLLAPTPVTISEAEFTGDDEQLLMDLNAYEEPCK